MLAYAASLILPFFLFSIGFWLTRRVFGFEGRWRWSLAYPVGMACVGLMSYFLWLLEVPWPLIVISVASAGVILSQELFVEIRTFTRSKLEKLIADVQTVLTSLTPLESILLATVAFSSTIVTLWHFFVRPYVWDSFVLYDFRALRIAEGWQLERFFQQFVFDSRFAGYDFSHPFLSSIWQALAYSTQAPVSTFLYWGLLLSIVSVAALCLQNKRGLIVFVTLLLSSAPLFTVWWQNYAVEPYTLFWFLIIFLSFHQNQRRFTPVILLFLLTSMLLRVSAPYWFFFLVWMTAPILLRKMDLAQKILMLTFLWLPALAIFAHWQQLQWEVVRFSEVSADKVLSSYDPSRYGNIANTLLLPEFWLRYGETLLLKNPVVRYVLCALVFGVFFARKSWKTQESALLFLFVAMLAAAFVVEMAGDWPEWKGKARLLERVGIPVIVVASVVTAQRIERQPSLNSRNRRTPRGE